MPLPHLKDSIGLLKNRTVVCCSGTNGVTLSEPEHAVQNHNVKRNVGADLYIRPKVESLNKENRRLSCRGGFVYPPVNRHDIVRNHNMLGNADITKCNIRSAPPNHGYRKRNE